MLHGVRSLPPNVAEPGCPLFVPPGNIREPRSVVIPRRLIRIANGQTEEARTGGIERTAQAGPASAVSRRPHADQEPFQERTDYGVARSRPDERILNAQVIDAGVVREIVVIPRREEVGRGPVVVVFVVVVIVGGGS